MLCHVCFACLCVINASMYDPKGRSVSFMVDGDRVNNGRDEARFGGLIGFHPKANGAPEMAFFGKSCADFDLPKVRKNYETVMANYRLLSCEGAPITWKDEAHSAAAIGMDKKGQFVMMLARAPYRMETFARIIAAPDLGITSAL